VRWARAPRAPLPHLPVPVHRCPPAGATGRRHRHRWAWMQLRTTGSVGCRGWTANRDDV